MKPKIDKTISQTYSEEVFKQQPTSIEEAAAKYANDYDGMQWEKDRVEIAFIEGAKYQEAKETELIDKALDRLKLADDALMKYNPNWSTDEQLKIVLNFISTAHHSIKQFKQEKK